MRLFPPCVNHMQRFGYTVLRLSKLASQVIRYAGSQDWPPVSKIVLPPLGETLEVATHFVQRFLAPTGRHKRL